MLFRLTELSIFFPENENLISHDKQLRLQYAVFQAGFKASICTRVNFRD